MQNQYPQRLNAMPLTENHKEDWTEGGTAFFEYRCHESLNSADSDLWARSHQRVEILGEADWEKEIGHDLSQTERIEAGVPKMYRIRFEDGHEGSAHEDELLTRPEWARPHPPARVRREEGVAQDPIGEDHFDLSEREVRLLKRLREEFGGKVAGPDYHVRPRSLASPRTNEGKSLQQACGSLEDKGFLRPHRAYPDHAPVYEIMPEAWEALRKSRAGQRKESA